MSDVRFEAGGRRCRLDVSHIVEVVPGVALRAVPNAPPALAGVMRYRGDEVPVVDLGLLFADTSAVSRFSTRILIVRTARSGGDGDLVGLLAEQVLEVADSTAPADSIDSIDDARLGPEWLADAIRRATAWNP